MCCYSGPGPGVAWDLIDGSTGHSQSTSSSEASTTAAAITDSSSRFTSETGRSTPGAWEYSAQSISSTGENTMFLEEIAN